MNTFKFDGTQILRKGRSNLKTEFNVNLIPPQTFVQFIKYN